MIAALGLGTPTPTPDEGPARSAWATYRDRFIAADGRVVDGANGGISHSEGQGFALLLAAHHGDRPAFEKVWGWTRAHLRTRGDRLFAWKWTPEAGVADANDAADGDLLIAWALLRGARRWKAPAWRAEALGIGADVLAKLYRTKGELAYVLPGATGFERREGDVVNPSYWVYPALDELAAASGRPEWRRLAASGVVLAKRARFGKHGLPPDWLQLTEPPRPAPGFAARFGYDAVRVPLYLMWGARPASLVAPFKACWRSFPPGARPAWIALDEGADAPFAQAPGMRAIAEAALAYPGLPKAQLPPPDAKADYYDASLQLLTAAMREERRRP